MREASQLRAAVRAPSPKPRNSVVLAAVHRLVRLGTKRHRNDRRAHDDSDLAQRVREIGEW